MIGWEYIAPFLYGDLETLLAQLAPLGREGWEVVQIEPRCSDGGQRIFLKRMLRPTPPVLVPEDFDMRPGAVNHVR